MAFVAGRSTTVLYNEVNASGLLNSAGINVAAGTTDTTNFASGGWAENKATNLSASFPFAGMWDTTATATWQNALGADAGVLTYSPGAGAAIGDPCRMAPITSTAYAETAPVGGIVGLSWTANAEGAVAFGNILHPLATDTNTTTGATRDDAAATATGWTAHLHVTAISSGSWTIKLQDSADNSSWADVTGASFAALTAAGSQRLTSASGTTALRRYVRYVATVTGGSTPTITFALAYARTNQ